MNGLWVTTEFCQTSKSAINFILTMEIWIQQLVQFIRMSSFKIFFYCNNFLKRKKNWIKKKGFFFFLVQRKKKRFALFFFGDLNFY